MKWGLISGMATDALPRRMVVPALPAGASGGDISEQKMAQALSPGLRAGDGE